MAAATLALAASTTSCLDSEEEGFKVSVTGYVIQDYAADSTKLFSPYFTVATNLATEPLQSVSFKGLNNSLAMTKV
ncbi:hypothetical protein NP174_23275, partial [Salmonella enterica]|nr:hypothetical protein [Salmonella enterica]